jgi:CDP-4-dehydro-6-deoxyglucose reductase, E3
MDFQISVQPSGQTFQFNSEETVLTAAIAAGLSLPYGCRNGACGACKGKVLQGQVEHTKYQATALSPGELESGYALFCCAKPLSDLVIECREVSASNGVKPRILPVRVQKLNRLSDDVMELSLKLPSNERLQFSAGQYIEFILKDGKRRAFSLANAPHDDEFLQLHLRLVPNGLFTSYVFNELQEKSIMRIEGPFGSFYLREENDKPLIMLAGGTGFAPIKAIIEHMFHHNISREIYLYWGAKTLHDLYMRALPEAWVSEHTNLHYVPVLSEPSVQDAWNGRTGLVHKAVLDDFDELSVYQVYCCGAPGMIEAASKEFQAKGLSADSFFADAFTFAAS